MQAQYWHKKINVRNDCLAGKHKYECVQEYRHVGKDVFDFYFVGIIKNKQLHAMGRCALGQYSLRFLYSLLGMRVSYCFSLAPRPSKSSQPRFHRNNPPPALPQCEHGS